MKQIKAIAKRIPGVPALYIAYRRQMKVRRWQARRMKSYHWEWARDEQAKLSRQRIHALHNKHRGERCFIIGNGPSLNKMDLSPLRDEYTFGTNRIYLLFDRMGFHTSYYASVNELVIEQFGRDIEALPMPKFIEWERRHLLKQTNDLMFIRSDLKQPGFYGHDVPGGIWQGSTVTYVCMQIAFYLGFETVYLIGVDHNFKTRGPAHKQVVSEGDDPNHFHPDYFGQGSRWHLPDLDESEVAYRMARGAYEADGRRILDATVSGKLNVFEKVDYDSLF